MGALARDGKKIDKAWDGGDPNKLQSLLNASVKAAVDTLIKTHPNPKKMDEEESKDSGEDKDKE